MRGACKYTIYVSVLQYVYPTSSYHDEGKNTIYCAALLVIMNTTQRHKHHQALIF